MIDPNRAADRGSGADQLIGVISCCGRGAQKIILGGAGDWGIVPMVPNEHVSMANVRRLAAWILGLGDTKH